MPQPVPAHGEVLIRIRAVSLNYRDYMNVAGIKGVTGPIPRIPCSDGAGEVVTDRPFTIGRGEHPVELPADFAIGPRDREADGLVTVEVVALLGPDSLLTARAITGFRRNESVRLDILLPLACVHVDCSLEETCTERGLCAPAAIDPTLLPVFDGSSP